MGKFEGGKMKPIHEKVDPVFILNWRMLVNPEAGS